MLESVEHEKLTQVQKEALEKFKDDILKEADFEIMGSQNDIDEKWKVLNRRIRDAIDKEPSLEMQRKLWELKDALMASAEEAKERSFLKSVSEQSENQEAAEAGEESMEDNN